MAAGSPCQATVPGQHATEVSFPFGDICAELKLMFGCARCEVPLALLLVLGTRKDRIWKMLGCTNRKDTRT